ncbi:IPT/TIG domain-containing protein [Xanthocytophaga flava]|uniref:IPT/TIG domain-containing protein n=1 Tax=Xanthocytophaga flava TaxID=3048013 RepID=UPI0028D14900|nr:IPT/TIG domain-containing protein [Xanthocytophaga flavus]MDJ1473642.1 IPT/TIG domain-containing protein [Xanthocytophaga flavus]
MKRYISKILILQLIAAVWLSSCKKDDELNPSVGQVTPEKGASNTLLTLTGSDIEDVQTIVFEKGNVKAEFNPNFNTDNALLFRVPVAAVPGEQNIILTNKKGKEFRVPFNVLGFATITDVSNYNFSDGSEITLTGRNLDDVSKVVFSGTTTEVAILSKTPTTLVLKFPATELTQTTLDITNAAGAAKTSQSFVAVDNAYKIFTDGYNNGYQDASWGSSGMISTTIFKTGTASVYKDFAAGNWHQFGFGWNELANNNYKYLSFWIKGASADYDLYISTPASKGGFASFESNTKITVPANVWTYFKLPVNTLGLWATADKWNQIGWRIQGPDGKDERFYLDDVILIK